MKVIDLTQNSYCRTYPVCIYPFSMILKCRLFSTLLFVAEWMIADSNTPTGHAIEYISPVITPSFGTRKALSNVPISERRFDQKVFRHPHKGYHNDSKTKRYTKIR